jgi:hypothetical protein
LGGGSRRLSARSPQGIGNEILQALIPERERPDEKTETSADDDQVSAVSQALAEPG